MTRKTLTLLLTLLAGPGLAQNACVAPPPVGDPCMVGHWVGENTAPARIRAALQGMAPDSVIRQIEAASSPVLGMSVYEDGFYHTLPFHHGTDFTDTFVATGQVVDVELDLAVPMQVGFIHGSGGRITFCDAGSAPALFAMSANGEGLAGPVTGGTRYVPAIRYVCAGDAMTMQVALPAPIGPVDYAMTRVSEAIFDETLGALQDAARAAAR